MSSSLQASFKMLSESIYSHSNLSQSFRTYVVSTSPSMASLMVARSCLLAVLVVVAVVPPAYAQCNTTLLQAVAANPALSQLATVIQQAGLNDKINKTDNVTVLAPNNAAFNGTGGLISILQQNGLSLANVTQGDDRAASIILYHFITVAATASQLVNGQSLSTSLEGYNLTVSKTSTVTFVGYANNATVVTPDLRVCNSVVHVVDHVLLPNATVSAIPTYNSHTPTPGVGGGASGLGIGTWTFVLTGALVVALTM